MTSAKADYIYGALQKVTANRLLFKKDFLKMSINKITLPWLHTMQGVVSMFT